ncbi:hypothetical protein J4E86_006135 [Alternaria arbusti]|uniref:uncharacterized protein n=1 Tax=Alternaria arbusti TaxID=232088 RepID=UPI0022204A6B|nr:uncharacterized protein J4E86_006135 [Alternaria arbusti]KAI4954825.1 hypothetical protein J4E86_006135 [Alternaria arbusti]
MGPRGQRENELFSTPPSSTAAPVQQNQARRRAAVHERRRHNSTVARYLGLGGADEPTHLEIRAPSPALPRSPPPKPRRKRPRLAVQGSTSDGRRVNPEGNGLPDQPRVSESFRTKKPSRNSAASRSKASLSTTTPQSIFVDDAQTPRSTTTGNGTAVSHQDHLSQACNVTDYGFASPETIRNVSQDTVAALPVQYPTALCEFDFDDNDFDTSEPEQLDAPLAPLQIENSMLAQDDFDFDINDDDLLTLTSEIDDAYPDLANAALNRSVQPGDRDDDRLRHPPGTCADAPTILDGSPDKKTCQPVSKQFTSPVTLTTRLQAATGDLGSSKIRKPFVRPPFPEAVRDRSPIIGLSSNLLLRTCFRIGEVINQSCQASKSGKHIMIEMYARVLASERTSTEQQFTFCDLFHAKPPYIKAVYNAAVWKSVQLFEYDSRRLLQQGRICRCIGTMKREGKEWTMTVLNIWEATWEDIEWVQGIVDS